MKNVLNVVNIMCTIYDIGRQIMEAALDPDSTPEDIIRAAARGIVTGVFINLMCKIKGLGPVLTKIFTAAGLGQQVQSIIHYTKEGKYDLAVTGTIELIIQLMSMSQTCFTGDTLVSTEDGQKRIDEIEVGDKVWAYDIYTGKTELKEVLTVYVHDQDEILHLKTTAGDIDTTTNHPFYVMEKGWVAAGDLENGDEVYLIDGDSAVVTGSELEKPDEAIKVYNLEVEGYNTYFVGDDGVLVHNYPGQGNGSTNGKTTAPFDIVDYGDKTVGQENHHGVLDVWATNNIDEYVSRASDSTTIALTKPQHNATKSVYRDWLFEKTGKKVGGKVDWKSVSPREIQSLAERMFDAAGVPDYARRNYYNEFNKYIYKLGGYT